MLINCSNHPQKEWDGKQLELAVKQFDYIVDVSFPMIDPKWSTDVIVALAKEQSETILTTLAGLSDIENKRSAVHIMGEMTFVYGCVKILQEHSILCLASTSYRKVKMVDGQKIVRFNFENFRAYPKL